MKAHALLPLLLLDIEGEWRPVWVAWAERVTVRRLAEDVERMLLLRAGHPLAWTSSTTGLPGPIPGGVAK